MSSLHNVGLFDMDGSLCDYEGRLRRDLNRLRSPGEPEIANLWQLENKYPYMRARMRLVKSQTNWWFKLPPIALGMRVFAAAHEIGFTNMVLTKGPKGLPNAWGEKRAWCEKYLGRDVPVTVTENKGLTYGKFLYDDFPDYARDWLEHRHNGLVIMPVTDSNRDNFPNHPQILRCTEENFDEVYAALVACYHRIPGEPLKL
jgi:hypothetical protein